MHVLEIKDNPSFMKGMFTMLVIWLLHFFLIPKQVNVTNPEMVACVLKKTDWVSAVTEDTTNVPKFANDELVDSNIVSNDDDEIGSGYIASIKEEVNLGVGEDIDSGYPVDPNYEDTSEATISIEDGIELGDSINDDEIIDTGDITSEDDEIEIIDSDDDYDVSYGINNETSDGTTTVRESEVEDIVVEDDVNSDNGAVKVRIQTWGLYRKG